MAVEINKIKMDLLRLPRKSSHGFINLILIYLTNSGFRAVFLIRLIEFFSKRNALIAKIIQFRLLKYYGCDVSLGLEIQGGLRIDHPVGVVIGSGVKIGRYCTIGSHVIIGEKYIDSRSTGEYPFIGDEVTLAANTTIIGNLSIQSFVCTGANSLVLTSVPMNTRVIGTWK
jgi:serine O-acetyltransferase